MAAILDRLKHLGKKHREEANRHEPNRTWSELDALEINEKLYDDALWQEVAQTAGLETSPVSPDKALLIYRNAFLNKNIDANHHKIPLTDKHNCVPETNLESPSYDSCYADDDEFEIPPLMSKNI